MVVVLAFLPVSVAPMRRDTEPDTVQVPRECLSRRETLVLTQMIDERSQNRLWPVRRVARRRQRSDPCVLGTMSWS